MSATSSDPAVRLTAVDPMSIIRSGSYVVRQVLAGIIGVPASVSA